MDISFLENQDELNIGSFNGSFRKALEKGKADDNPKKIEKRQPSRAKKKDLPDISKASLSDSVRISISKANDRRIREMIIDHYTQTGERLSIKQFVNNCIDFYFDKNKK